MTQPKCARCLQLVSREDTVVFDGGQLMHLDCRRPRDLSPEERALLFKYCFDHAVREDERAVAALRNTILGRSGRSCRVPSQPTACTAASRSRSRPSTPPTPEPPSTRRAADGQSVLMGGW